MLAAVLAPQFALAAPQTAPSEMQVKHTTSFLQLLMRGGWFMLPIAVASPASDTMTCAAAK